MFGYIKEYLKANDVEYKENIKLSEISPIKIGGAAKILIYPETVDGFVKVMDFMRLNGLNYKIVGNMSNILPTDEEYEGILIKTDRLSDCSVEGCEAVCDCGVKIPALALLLAEKGLSGIEELSGIPGQLGGCICGNAGAFGREISEVLSDCVVYHKPTGDVRTVKAAELDFAYRNSVLKNGSDVILTARLSLAYSDREAVRDRIKKYRAARVASQPVGEATLGSVFRRTADNISAGKLIDECGLRGFGYGDALFSPKHAGFIVNKGKATSSEVKELISLAKMVVKSRFSLDLECEIEFL